MLTTWIISGLSVAVGFVLGWLTFSIRTRTARQLRPTDALISEARTDALTGLKNRRSFNEELNRQFAQRQRQGSLFSVLLIDIDHFKQVNDSLGHLAGDSVLRAISERLTKTLREMDLIYRYGGDEFAVICPGTRLREVATAAERIRNAIAMTPVSINDRSIMLTLSIGAAEVRDSEATDGLLQRADDALYAAKHAGRNRVHLHDGQTCVPAHAN